MKTQLRISKAGREKVLHKYDCRCAYCGKPITSDTLALDSNNGNINPSCMRCKNRKGNDTIEQFRSHISVEIKLLKTRNQRFSLAVDYGLIKETYEEVLFYFEKRELENMKQEFSITTDVAYCLSTPTKDDRGEGVPFGSAICHIASVGAKETIKYTDSIHPQSVKKVTSCKDCPLYTKLEAHDYQYCSYPGKEQSCQLWVDMFVKCPLKEKALTIEIG
jgi:hypothetical protein